MCACVLPIDRHTTNRAGLVNSRYVCIFITHYSKYLVPLPTLSCLHSLMHACVWCRTFTEREIDAWDPHAPLTRTALSIIHISILLFLSYHVRQTPVILSVFRALCAAVHVLVARRPMLAPPTHLVFVRARFRGRLVR